MYNTTHEYNWLKGQTFPRILISLCVLITSSFILVLAPNKFDEKQTSNIVSLYNYYQDYYFVPVVSTARNNLNRIYYDEDNTYRKKVWIHNIPISSWTDITFAQFYGNINYLSSLAGISRIESRQAYLLLDIPPPSITLS